MDLFINRHGKREFYGHEPKGPLDFSFFDPTLRFCSLLQERSEYEYLKNFYEGRTFDDFILFSNDNKVLKLDGQIKDLHSFRPSEFDFVVVFSELNDELEKKLKKFSHEEERYFAIAEVFRKSSPSDVTQEVRFKGINFHLFQSVEIPAYYTNWAYINYLTSQIKKKNYKNILEMFAGSGAIGFSLGRELPYLKVDCLDANYHAIRSMRQTLEEAGLQNINVYLSELFSSLRSNEKSYDLIVGNPPHLNMPLDFPGQMNGRDPNFEIHRNFYLEAADFLSDGGEVIMIENVGSEIFNSFYQDMPNGLKLTEVVRLPDGFWDLVHVSKC